MRLDIDSWIFAADGKAVLVIGKGEVLRLDVATGTNSVLPVLENRAAIGFLADDQIAAVSYTPTPGASCMGAVRSCLLKDNQWACGDPALMGGWGDPSCPRPAWSDAPAFTSTERGPKVAVCGKFSAGPMPDAFQPPIPNATWSFQGKDPAWGFQLGKADCGAIAEYPAIAWNGTKWVTLHISPDAQPGDAIPFEQSGPWLLLYADQSALFDLASDTPERKVSEFWQGTLWPDGIPIPPKVASASAPAKETP